jgi:hypothetical protein
VRLSIALFDVRRKVSFAGMHHMLPSCALSAHKSAHWLNSPYALRRSADGRWAGVAGCEFFRLYTPGDFAERITLRSSVYQDDQCAARHWLGSSLGAPFSGNLVPRLGAILGVLSNEAHRVTFPNGAFGVSAAHSPCPQRCPGTDTTPGKASVCGICMSSCGDVRMHSLRADGL